MTVRSSLLLVVFLSVSQVVFAGGPCAPDGETNCTNCAFRIEATTLLTGSTGNVIEVVADNDICLFGYSVGLLAGPGLMIQDVSEVGTVAEDATFFDGEISAEGDRAGYGIVFDFGDFTSNNLPPGTDSTILMVTVDVTASEDTVSSLAFREVELSPTAPPVRNIMTNIEASTVVPATTDGVITLETRAPEIDSVTPDQGLAGDTLTIEGAFYDQANLAVTICDVAVPAGDVNIVDADTLEVVAPSCATIGCVDVVVSTDRGTATAADGFCYIVPPPAITGFEDNTGPPGTEFVILGENFDQPNLTVTVCDTELASVSVSGDGTRITATSPDCGTLGCVAVVVSTDGGSDTDADGYCYNGFPAEFTSIDPVSGVAGTQVTITGANFQFAGFEVLICGEDAQAQAPADGGTTVVATVPTCSAGGLVDVEVRNDFGGEIATAVFEYIPGLGPVIQTVDPTSGSAGDTVTITGDNFEFDGLSVTFCDIVVEPTVGDGELTVEVPDCASDGTVSIVVANDFGSDTADFEIEPDGIPYIRGDSNDSGSVDLSDGVNILNVLFQGFGEIPCDAAADSNSSGSVDLSDAVNIFNVLFLGSGEILPPNACGEAFATPEECAEYTRC